MKKTVQNEEHLEAQQEEVDQCRNKWIASLSEEERGKFKAVDEAVKILTDAKIYAYVFPMLPFNGPNGKKINQVYQYNSILELTEFDSSGKMNEASFEKNNRFHEGFINWFYFFFRNQGCYSGSTYEEEMETFSVWITRRLHSWAKYMKGDDQND